jgi:lysozyme
MSVISFILSLFKEEKEIQSAQETQSVMTYSQVAVDLIKKFEGCRLTAYKDGNGILTIGWGHTGDDVVWNTTWTQEHADLILLDDIKKRAVDSLNRLLKVSLNQNRFDALVSLCYNIGEGNLRTSHVLVYTNAMMFSYVPMNIMRWDIISGKKSEGLFQRRMEEVALWNKPIKSA